MTVLFFDDCHKIYYAGEDDTELIEQMEGYGYDPIYSENLAKDLQELWEDSCGLRFVSHADFLGPSIPQFDERENIEDFAQEILDFLND